MDVARVVDARRRDLALGYVQHAGQSTLAATELGELARRARDARGVPPGVSIDAAGERGGFAHVLAMRDARRAPGARVVVVEV